MKRQVNGVDVWTSMLFVFLLVAVVQSHPPVRDHVDETPTTSTADTVQADSRLQRNRMIFWTAARTNPVRRRPPQPPLPQPASSVQLVGVDVRRIQQKDVTTSETGVNDDETHNSTNLASNVDMTLDDQLRLARIR